VRREHVAVLFDLFDVVGDFGLAVEVLQLGERSLACLEAAGDAREDQVAYASGFACVRYILPLPEFIFLGHDGWVVIVGYCKDRVRTFHCCLDGAQVVKVRLHNDTTARRKGLGRCARGISSDSAEIILGC
jgi:hypothetical protein